jgi:hypothetical protein
MEVVLEASLTKDGQLLGRQLGLFFPIGHGDVVDVLDSDSVLSYRCIRQR